MDARKKPNGKKPGTVPVIEIESVQCGLCPQVLFADPSVEPEMAAAHAGWWLSYDGWHCPAHRPIQVLAVRDDAGLIQVFAQDADSGAIMLPKYGTFDSDETFSAWAQAKGYSRTVALGRESCTITGIYRASIGR